MNTEITQWVAWFDAYLLAEKCVSKNTFSAYQHDIMQLCDYLAIEQIEPPISEQHLKDFIYHLSGQGLSGRSMARKISTLKLFFGYLHERHGIDNVARELVFPKLEKRLPHVLSEEDIERLFALAEADASEHGLRNKVMLSLLYVCGLRISELIHLKVSDLHRDTGFISVTGKGGKTRLIPVPQPMLVLLDHYLVTKHKEFIHGQGGERFTDYMFPTFYGKKVKPITRQSFWIILRNLWEQSGVHKPLSPHMLRHSFATHMLKRGADLRSLQLLLGHESIATVQIYTHVETDYLRDMYDKKHPRS